MYLRIVLSYNGFLSTAEALNIINMRFICFPIENGRYIVFLFRADDYAGELRSSDEGEMQWVELSELPGLCTVDDFDKLIRVMLDDALNEFQYVKCDDKWIAMLK